MTIQMWRNWIGKVKRCALLQLTSRIVCNCDSLPRVSAKKMAEAGACASSSTGQNSLQPYYGVIYQQFASPICLMILVGDCDCTAQCRGLSYLIMGILCLLPIVGFLWTFTCLEAVMPLGGSFFTRSFQSVSTYSLRLSGWPSRSLFQMGKCDNHLIGLRMFKGNNTGKSLRFHGKIYGFP